jgi:hypothetical protein
MICPTPWCSVEVTISRQRVFAAVFTIIPANKGMIIRLIASKDRRSASIYT